MKQGRDYIQLFVEAIGWKDSLESDEEGKITKLATLIRFDKRLCRLFIEAYEDARRIYVFLYLPFDVDHSKRLDALQTINHINFRLGVGHFEISDEAQPCLRFRLVIDLDGVLQWDDRLVGCMYDAACGAVKQWIDVLQAVSTKALNYEEFTHELALTHDKDAS